MCPVPPNVSMLPVCNDPGNVAIVPADKRDSPGGPVALFRTEPLPPQSVFVALVCGCFVLVRSDMFIAQEAQPRRICRGDNEHSIQSLS